MAQMEDFETPVLIDMLSEYTQKVTSLFALHKGLIHDPDYEWNKETIKRIMKELERRRNSKESDKPALKLHRT